MKKILLLFLAITVLGIVHSKAQTAFYINNTSGVPVTIQVQMPNGQATSPFPVTPNPNFLPVNLYGFAYCGVIIYTYNDQGQLVNSFTPNDYLYAGRYYTIYWNPQTMRYELSYN